MTGVALVSGGNKGIGLEVTRLLSLLDYEVIVVAREVEQVAELDQPNIRKIKFDLTKVDLIPDLVADIKGVDLLVNNAGLMHSLPFDQYPEEKMRELMKLNIEAPIALIREVSKYMVDQGAGRIVNNASIAGHIGHPDVWYGVSKAGLINATKSFAKLLGPKGIVVNAVAPGPVVTDMLDVIPEFRKEAVLKTVYSGRFAEASEVAKTIVWLGTECPSYINGTCIDINDGAFPR